jgi:hypothetical protein
MDARRFATALMKPRCTGSSASNTSAVGGFFGPDQKGVPDAVT